ncbi:hypothetical protein [Fontivita pretiosa]|uniref:hypothetical protein n=1 Tax=Fontivita pretiosa TaxID=2989684 RepID=UPI003D170226
MRKHRQPSRSFRGTSRIASVAVVAAGMTTCIPLLQGQDIRRRELFPGEQPNWQGVNNHVDGNNYGFSATNFTIFTNASGTVVFSGPPEIGGTFARSNSRGYYADVRHVGILTQDHFIHADGEMFFGNGATGDTDHVIGHLNRQTLAGGNFNILGLGIFEDGAAGFRFTAQLYGDDGIDVHGVRQSIPNGVYKWSYDWDPNTDTLTARILDPNDGVTVIASDSVSGAGKVFTLNAFGFNSGLNSNTDATKTYDIYIDAVNYTVSPQWNQDFSGNWDAVTNWAYTAGTTPPPVPNGVDAVANFYYAASAPRTIVTDTAKTLGTLRLANANSYTIGGAGTLTMDVSSGQAQIVVIEGSQRINLPLRLNDNTTADVSGGATLTIADPLTLVGGSTLTKTGPGAMDITAPVSSSVSAAMVARGGTLNVHQAISSRISLVAEGGAINLHATQRLAAIHLTAGGQLSLSGGTDKLLAVGGDINISGSGRINLNDNRLIAASADLAAVSANIKNALDNDGAYNWRGAGIGSDRAAELNSAGSFLYGLGVIRNDLAQVGGSGPVYTLFAGESLRGNEILVSFTYMGDADLSGVIDATDYGLIDNGYVQQLSGWIHGDFDYSGVIDATDYALIDNAYLHQSGTAAQAAIARHSEQFGGEYLAALRAVQAGVIPEPTTVGLMGLAGWSLRRPRRCARRHTRAASPLPLRRRIGARLPSLIAVASGALASAFGAVASAQITTKTENFNTDPGWDGFNNHSAANLALTGPQNYGWSPTNHVGLGAGEAGGQIFRASGTGIDSGTFGPNYVPSYYGDKVGMLDMTTPLSFSGTVWYDDQNGATQFGFFKHDTLGSGGGPQNFMGFFIDGGRPAPDGSAGLARYIDVWVQMYSTRPGQNPWEEGDRNRFMLLSRIPDNAATAEGGPANYSFQWNWDPVAGKATGHFAGTSFELFANSLNLTNIYDRFGFGGIPANGNRVQAFFDNLSYSTAFVPAATTEWTGARGGEWLNSGNWTAQAPNGVGAEAHFLGGATAPVSVYTDSPVTLGTARFNNTNSYVLTGTSPLTMNVASGTALIDVQAGTHRINLPISFAANGSIAVASGATLTISDPLTIQANRTVSKSGNLLIEAPLTIEPGGVLNLGNGVSALYKAPTLGTGAKVNITGSGVNVLEGNLATVTAQIKTALENGGNFDWQGPGIGSTRAFQQNQTAGSFLYGLGVVLNDLAQVGGSGPIYTTFNGQSVASDDVLVKFTYFGDADLSGSIDATDYSLIDNGYVNTLSGWINGDFDYSGTIDATDYALIDNAYVNQAGPLAEALIAEHTRMFGGEYLAALRAIQSGVIPEPASLGLLLGVACSLRRSRLRRQ